MTTWLKNKKRVIFFDPSFQCFSPIYHENDGGCACEHVFATDRTIALQIPLNASVSVFHGHGHANIAFMAMEEILAKTFSLSTNPTIIAVVDRLVLVIIPEFALVAIIRCHLNSTITAVLTGWLSLITLHADHLLGFMSNNIVIAHFIVTKATREYDTTAVGHQFHFATIVLAS